MHFLSQIWRPGRYDAAWMAPDPGATRTVGCNLIKLVPDATVLADIQTAVERAQTATIQACMLLNLHIRRCLDANLPLD